jgi:mono/diheme cytochrome c family protein
VLVLLQAPAKTVLDGVDTDAQATHGQAIYTALCRGCHGNMLEGVSAPALTDRRFIERWREGSLDGIYSFITQRMPLGRPANLPRIPDADYLDILTYILKMNDYPSGPAALTPSLLNDVIFVGKNGPQPVPDGALVVSIGCLSQASNGVWILSAATEPVRAELKTSAQKPLGTMTFRLADIDAVPDFEPEAHNGHKMRVKGYLTRQPNAERIGLSSIDMLESTCRP